MKSDWERDKLSIRVYDCINRLLNFLEAGRLPQYFNPKVNLLAGEDGTADGVRVIKNFLLNPPQLRITPA